MKPPIERVNDALICVWAWARLSAQYENKKEYPWRVESAMEEVRRAIAEFQAIDNPCDDDDIRRIVRAAHRARSTVEAAWARWNNPGWTEVRSELDRFLALVRQTLP